MTINIEKRDIGISIKVYITQQDLKAEPMQKITADSSKDFRKQKTYKFPNFSDAKGMLLKQIIEIMYSQYTYFYEIIIETTNISQDAIRSKVYTIISRNIDSYGNKVFDEIFDYAFRFVFDIKSEYEVHSIKDQYQLSDNDLMIATIGTYGYGKTTLIKKIFGFDEFIFPLVDKGRTTINSCYLRGMLVKDGMIQNKDANLYKFKNQITLRSSDDFFNSVLVIQFSNAYNKFVSHESEENIEEEVLVDFVTTDLAKLDEFFGDVEEFIKNKPKDHFYQKVLDSMRHINTTNTENRSIIEIISSLNIKRDFEAIYNKKINEALKYLNEAIYSNNIITFYITIDEISKIDDYYFHFISNSSKHRGHLLRSIVKEIYLEVDLNTNEIQNSELFNSKSNITSILLADTMGAGHTSNKSSTTSEKIDINKNFSLLNESDILLLLDDATQTMNPTTLQQIKLLDSYGLREKAILVYSKYNYFVKNDLKSDSEREKYLIEKLKEKLFEIFPTTQESKTEKAKLVFNMFSNETKQLVFLKGLIPYEYNKQVPEKDINTNANKRTNKSNINNQDVLDNDSRARLLNRDIENSTECLTDLFNKICNLFYNLKELGNTRCTIISNVEDLTLALSFFESYSKFDEKLSKSEYEEYVIAPPEWNTSEALCYKLYIGETGFYGVSRTLFPLEDAKSEFILTFNDFIENKFTLTIDGDNNLTEDFLKNKIKVIFTNSINELFYTYFIKLNKNDWFNLYKDYGSSVKRRRSNSIYELIYNTFSQNSFIKNSAYQLFISAASKVINEYKS